MTNCQFIRCAQKSVAILSKFWGDDATNIDVNDLYIADTVTSSKEEVALHSVLNSKKKKKQKYTVMYKSSKGIRTRSKKGLSNNNSP